MSDQTPYQQPYQQPYPQGGGYLPYAAWVPQKHSGVGVASFIIAIAVGLLELAMVVLAAVLVQHASSQTPPTMAFAGCGMLLGLAACVVGVVLGIVGLGQSDRRKLFAVLGLCFNALILLFVLGLMLLGLAMKR